MNIWLRKLMGNRLFLVLLLLNVMLVSFFLLSPGLAPNDPIEIHPDLALLEYSGDYPLGTDQLGRCYLSRLMYGGKATLVMTFGIVLFITERCRRS